MDPIGSALYLIRVADSEVLDSEVSDSEVPHLEVSDFVVRKSFQLIGSLSFILMARWAWHGGIRNPWIANFASKYKATSAGLPRRSPTMLRVARWVQKYENS